MSVNVPQKIFSEGLTGKVAVYRVLNFTNGDTFNMSADFLRVQGAYLAGSTINSQNVPVVSADVVLTPAAGSWNKDEGYLLVYGAST